MTIPQHREGKPRMKEYDSNKYILVRKEIATFQKWFNWVVELLWKITLPLVCILIVVWAFAQLLEVYKSLLT